MIVRTKDVTMCSRKLLCRSARLVGLAICLIFISHVIDTTAQDTRPVAASESKREYDFSPPKGPNHRRVESIITVKDAAGRPVQKPSHYIELANGLHYFEDGQWKESQEKIEPHPRGAAALKGAYKAIFGKNINRAGSIELTLPDGQRQKNHPLGLYYYDRADDRWVKLSGIKDSEGVIVPPNRVLYKDAFDSIRADVLYTYQKGKFEADVILRERPPAPDSFGMNNETTMMEMATEFTDTPEPKKTEHVLKKERDTAKRSALRTPDITDESLDFGSIQMIPGSAFDSKKGPWKPLDQDKQIAVGKHWSKDGNRNFLIEQVDYQSFSQVLAGLNPRSSQLPSPNTGKRVWPGSPSTVNDESNPMTEGELDSSSGAVIDYIIVTGYSQSSVTFSGAETYYFSSPLTVNNCTFEPGTVLKYPPNTCSPVCYWLRVLNSVSGSGATTTAVDDDSIGEPITGISNGSPTGIYANTALWIAGNMSFSLSNMTNKYAVVGLLIQATDSGLNQRASNFRTLASTWGFSLHGPSDLTVVDPYFCGMTGGKYSDAIGSGHEGIIIHSGDTICPNTAPTISDMPDTYMFPNPATLNRDFTVADGETPNTLTVTASSSNASLVPNDSANLSTSGGGTARALNITPAPGQSGQTTITVTVSDGSLSAQDTFVLTVIANNPPVISNIPDWSTALNTPNAPIEFTVTGADPGSIILSADSNNSTLIPPANFTFDGSGANRTLVITPAADQSGTATINVHADDGTAVTTQSFVLTVHPDASTPKGGSVGNGRNPSAQFNGTGAGQVQLVGGPVIDASGTPPQLCPSISLDEIKKLRVNKLSTCNGSNPGTQTSVAKFGESSCGSGCRYKVEITVFARLLSLDSGYYPGHAILTLGEGALENTRHEIRAPFGTAPPGSCNMAEFTEKIIFDVEVGDELTLIYNPTLAPDFGVDDCEIKVIDARLIGVTAANGAACNPCVENGLGASNPGNGSVIIPISLGKIAYGDKSVRLQIYQEHPTPILTSPDALDLVGKGPEIVALRQNSNNVLRQIKTPSGLADIITLSNWVYRIDLYSNSGIGNNGAIDGEAGLYITNGTPAVVSYLIHNPAGSTNDPSQLRIIESRGDITRINDFVFASLSATSHAWSLSSPGNLSFVQNLSETNGSVRSETRTLYRDSSAADIYQRSRQKYQTFPFGQAVIEQTVDPDGAQLTTAYQYYTDPSDTGYGQVKQMDFPNGHWQIVEYDSQQRVTRVYSSFGTQSATTNPGLCRMVEFDYTPIDGSGDTGAYTPQLPRREIAYVLGQEVGRKFFVYKRAEQQEVVCTIPGAAWDDSTNLKTVTKQHESGAFKGEMLSVKHPDGTLTLYSYSNTSANKTTVIESGQPNENDTAIVAGTRTVTIVGLTGEFIARTVSDVASGITTTQEIVNPSDLDDQLRPTKTSYLDGTFETMIYDCCGLMAKTDRDGITTTFLYDDLKRLIKTTRLNISKLYTYDPSGRKIAEHRVGSDNITTLIHSYSYDMAGRLSAEINALGIVTRYTESYNSGTGETTRVTTYAAGTIDATTRIETFAKDGSLLKITGTAVNPVRYEYGVESENGIARLRTREIKLDSNYADTLEWTKTYVDFAGRIYKTVYADANGSPNEQSYFNSLGQLSKTIDPDGVTTLMAYNLEGALQDSALDTNHNSVIDYSGLDRVNRSLKDVLYNPALSANVHRARSIIFPNDNNGVTTQEIARVESSVDGLKSMRTSFGLISTSLKTIPSNGSWMVTETAPDGSKVISTYQNARLAAVSRMDSSNVQLGQTTYAYDALGRLASTTDARNGTISYTYDAMDRVVSVITPAPGNGQSPQVTRTVHDYFGRVKSVTRPDGTTVYNDYFLTGLLKRTYGSRVYPVEYTYDAQGRMKTMTTWSNFSSGAGAAVTTWNYDPYRGWLNSKRDAGNQGSDYTYTAAGRLLTRQWARGTPRVTATSFYNDLGEPTLLDYSDSTPDVTYRYDRRGRPIGCTANNITTTRYFHDAGHLLGESYSGGTLNGLRITNIFDAFFRRTQVSTKRNAATLSTTSYAYDNASRMTTVSDGGFSANYSYIANSPLVGQIDFKQGNTIRMTTNKQYDYLNRLQSISSTPGSKAHSAFYFYYQYNDGNQRVRSTLGDGSYWVYEYDPLGQVKSGKHYWAEHTLVPGQQFENAYDDIGNRITARSGGDAGGANLRSATYSPNSLNQYTSRTVPDSFDVLGLANSGASVTVNSSFADYRRGEYFQESVSIDNSGGNVWQPVSVIASNGDVNTTTTGSVFIAQTPEVFTYDADGNTLTDGRWMYIWDAENRLTQIASLPGSSTASQRKVTWEFDCQGRRIRETTYDGSSGSFVVTKDVKFLFDGLRCVTELNASNNAELRSYSWGLDLSGSLGGAGGVGGLVMLNSTGNGIHFYAMDGNGNTAGLVKGSDGTVSANYEYGIFGESLRTTGPMALDNEFCFSTKRINRTSDMVLYEYRPYSPSQARFLNKDPIEEQGGHNLYAFVANGPVDSIDVFGLFQPRFHRRITEVGLKGIPSLGKKCLKIIIDANTGQDHGAPLMAPFADPLNHGDNGLIKETIDRLYSRINDAGNSKCQKCPDIHNLLQEFGKSLHAIQDLYSHSTYVETFGSDVSKASNLSVWQFLNRDGTVNVPAGVVSANYPDHDDDLQSHLRLNKDTPSSLRGADSNNYAIKYFDLATNVAARHTSEFWMEFVSKLRKDQILMLQNCCR